MKGNREFIDGIYEKYENYEKYTKENKKLKRYGRYRILGMVASVMIISSLLIFSYENSMIVEKDPDINVQEAEPIMDLAVVDNFDNFYNIVKDISENQNYRQSFNVEQNEAITDDSALKGEVQSTQDYTTTNIQEENVDEADIVKTDGKRIYSVAEYEVIITDITDPNQMYVASKISLEEESIIPHDLYVNDDKLIVFANKYEGTVITSTGIIMEDVAKYPQNDKTVMLVYDLTNVQEPKEIRRIEIEGNLVSSRMIGENVYFVVNKNISLGGIINSERTSLDENEYKPKYVDTLESNDTKKIEFNDIAYFENPDTANYLILAGVNIKNNEEADIKAFLGAGDTVYCSEKNIYIIKNIIQYDEETREIHNNRTQILKFALDNGKVNYKADGEVEGYINNQFSIDESNGYLRIAVTVGNWAVLTNDTTNTLYVLNEELDEVGRLEGLAQGEKIYSVRYVDNLAYIVTFKEVDPLFVIDLSNPTMPILLGELKIPGYSTYLHPYDETHVIGIGYDVTANGNRTNGIKMSMFDISDMNNPKELFSIKVGGNYTDSEVTYNHKALYFSKEKNLIGFPIIDYDGVNEYKAQLYEIDLESGFKLRGEVEHKSEKNDDKFGYKNKILRILSVGDVLYSVSENQVKASNISSLEQINRLFF